MMPITTNNARRSWLGAVMATIIAVMLAVFQVTMPATAWADLSDNLSGQASPQKHTTAELPWYPADPSAFVPFHNPTAPRIVDNANLLTDAEEAELLAKITDMQDRLGMDFVLVTDITSYGLSRKLFAADFYKFNGYGVGDDYTGVVYFVCMDPNYRGYFTAACGSAQSLMTADNVESMDDITYDLFKGGEYSKAIMTQFDNLDYLYTNGHLPFDFTFVWMALVLAVIAGIIAGFASLGSKKKKMVTVAKAASAYQYAQAPVFTVKADHNLGTTVTRVLHVDHDSSSGGGGHSSYSSGFSGSGGGGSHSFSGGGRSF